MFLFKFLPTWIRIHMDMIGILDPDPHENLCGSETLNLILYRSVAEPPLFWAAPAPGGQGPAADSGSDLLGSAPAPGKKRRLQAAPAGLHTLKFFILSS